MTNNSSRSMIQPCVTEHGLGRFPGFFCSNEEESSETAAAAQLKPRFQLGHQTFVSLQPIKPGPPRPIFTWAESPAQPKCPAGPQFLLHFAVAHAPPVRMSRSSSTAISRAFLLFFSLL